CRHRREDRTRRAAGAGPEFDHRLGLRDAGHPDHPALEEPRAGYDRPDVPGVAQEALQEGKAVVLLRPQRLETEHRSVSPDKFDLDGSPDRTTDLRSAPRAPCDVRCLLATQ